MLGMQYAAMAASAQHHADMPAHLPACSFCIPLSRNVSRRRRVPKSTLQVNEQPGTYFWHGHSGMEKVDGLYGPLIVRPRNGIEPFQYDEERILLLSDDYHDTSGSLTFPLNRCCCRGCCCTCSKVHHESQLAACPGHCHAYIQLLGLCLFFDYIYITTFFVTNHPYLGPKAAFAWHILKGEGK